MCGTPDDDLVKVPYSIKAKDDMYILLDNENFVLIESKDDTHYLNNPNYDEFIQFLKCYIHTDIHNEFRIVHLMKGEILSGITHYNHI